MSGAGRAPSARHQLARRNRQLEIIHRVSQLLAETLDLDQVIGRILEEVDRLLAVTGCSVWLPDPATGDLVCTQASGPARDRVRGWRLRPGVGIAGRVLASGQPAVVPDLAADPTHHRTLVDSLPLDLRSLLAVPLLAQGEVIGVLEVVDAAPNRFDASDLELFVPLAAVAAKAIRNAQLYHRVRHELAERQAAEARLRTQALLLDSVREAVVATGLDGAVTYWGPGAERLYGYPAAETLGRPIGAFLRPRTGTEDAMVPAVLAAGSLEFRGHVRRPAGDAVWVHATVAAVRGPDGEPCGLVSVGRDITAQVEAQEALAASETRMRAQYQNNPIPTYTWQYRDGELVLVDWNRAAEAITEGRICELRGVTLDGFYGDRPHYRERIWRCFEERSVGVEEEFYHYRTIDKALYLRTSYAFVPPDLVMIHTEDVTERVQAQEALEVSLETARALLDATDDAALLVDLDGTITALNATAARRTRRPPAEVVGTSLYAYGSAEVADHRREMAAAVIASGAPLDFEETHDGRLFHNRLHPVKDPQGRVAALAAYSRDVTERAEAENALRRSAQRLEVLHQVDQAIAAAHSPQAIARAALAHVRPLVPYDAACVQVVDPDGRSWAGLACARDGGPPSVEGGDPCSLAPVAARLALLACGGVQAIADVRARPEAAAVVEALRAPAVRAYLLAPLRVEQVLVGALFIGSHTPDAYGEEHQEVVRELAGVLAVTIQNARLRQAAEDRSLDLQAVVARRTNDLETLYDITALAGESFDLGHTVDYALGRTLAALECQAGAVHVLDPERDGALALLAQRSVPPDLLAPLAALVDDPAFRRPLLERGEPVAISDLPADPRAGALAEAGRFRAWIAAPLRARGAVLGVLSLFCGARERVGVEDVALAGSIADHIGVAVQNARLHDRAQRAATLEERERLARDLHDSVSQSLYSLTLFSQAASNLAAEGRYERVTEVLRDVEATALGALKEMRLLLHELRPPELAAAGLLGALRRRLEAVEGRVGVATELLASTPLLELPPVVEEGLYRIAQEALNNALRHAAATEVAVRVDQAGAALVLAITDNGCGFDPAAVDGGRGMGLATMRQRAAALGGTLAIDSAPGDGTTVRFVGDTHPTWKHLDSGERTDG